MRDCRAVVIYPDEQESSSRSPSPWVQDIALIRRDAHPLLGSSANPSGSGVGDPGGGRLASLFGGGPLLT